MDEDLLGSLEYASQIAGSSLIMVLGHTSIGALCDTRGGKLRGY